MPIDRNFQRVEITIPKRDMFKQISERRDLNQITILSSLRFEPIPESVLDSLTFYEHYWKRGDKFYKLSDEYYGQTDYWWIIALFNKKPTEQHYKAGDLVLIPIEIDYLVERYGF